MKIIIPKSDGYTLMFEVEKAGIHCPSCGKKKCYCNEDSYDYDTGQCYVFCTSCRHGGYDIDFELVYDEYNAIIDAILNPSIQPKHNPRPPKKFEDMTEIEQAYRLAWERKAAKMLGPDKTLGKRIAGGQTIKFVKYSPLPRQDR